eukprot:TRINITY_DN20026_c0_g1_i1.p1 TRINITY_DN20026_c0_g1~~TRINITY_DN20026_c0_g1_i1.p1  ORF type:complete len:1001 (-),score=120.80 TRINITY_DN20026_c0_g1_i1:139-2856(-)
MTLRVGGSAADRLGWGSATSQSIALTPGYWDELLGFVETCGFNLSFDLNAMGSRRADDHSVWNGSDAQKILEHARAKRHRIWALQLGNEPGHWQTRHNGRPTAAEHASDFAGLQSLLDAVYGRDVMRPRVQGPDACIGQGTQESPCANMTYFRTFLKSAGAILDDVTVHCYGLEFKTQCNLDALLTPSLWESNLIPKIQAWKKAQEELAPGARLVLSETASSADGGCPGLSNSFAAGFYFVDALGLLAGQGLWQVYRQDLVGFSGIEGGSSYALAGDPGWFSRKSHGKLRPNPDYFTALLWRMLVGDVVLRNTLPQPRKGRAHVFCSTMGGVVFAYVNPSKQSSTFLVSYAGASLPEGRALHLYALTSPDGSLTSRRIALNGVVLSMTSSLTPQQVNADAMHLPPYSYGFVVDRTARIPACDSERRYSTSSLHHRPSNTRCLDPRHFGAIAGNPGGEPGPHWSQNTIAIQRAIDESALRAPFCVEISGGDFVTADLYLRSNMSFFVRDDARLLLAVNKTKFSMLQILNARNVVLGGGGTIYGNAEHYVAYFDAADNRFQPRDPDGNRPHMVFVEGSRNVRIEGLRVLNSSDWNIWIRKSEEVLIDGVAVIGDQRFPNNDGIHPDSCSGLTIRNSYIDVADDGISLVSHKEYGPLSDVLVHNVTVRSKSHAIKFGSVCEADCRDMMFENITIWDSNAGLSIQQRGQGDIHNITFRDIQVQTRYQAPRWWGNGEWLSVTVEPRYSGDKVGRAYDLRFEGISATSENGGLLSGLAGGGIHDVSFVGISVVIRAFANYSQGHGPPCCVPGGAVNITCMGTRDHRPSFIEDMNCTSYGNCRTPAEANALYLENVHNATIENITAEFSGRRLRWYGKCLAQDARTSGVTKRGFFNCVNGPSDSHVFEDLFV